MKYAIKSSNGTFYRRTTAIGPMFGGSAPEAAKFDTRLAAVDRMGTHSFAFVGCEVVALNEEQEGK